MAQSYITCHLSSKTEILIPRNPHKCNGRGRQPSCNSILGEMETRNSQSQLAEETNHISEL